MEYYIYLILFISLVAFFDLSQTKQGNSKLFIVTSISSLILFQSLRKWTVGIDAVTYLAFFDKLSNSSVADFLVEFSSVDKGFLIYNQFISWFTTDHQIFFFLVASTILIPIGYIIYKNSLNVYVSLITFISFGIFNFTFSGIRQSIAISITFLSFELIKKKKWISFVGLVLLASSFHQSALIFLPAYPLYYFKIEKKYFIFILAFIAIVFAFKSYLLRLFISTAFEKYDNSDLLVSTGAYTLFILMLLLYAISVFVQKDSKSDKYLRIYSNYMLIAVIIQIGASESQIAMRAGYYYFIYMALLLPEIIATYRSKNVRFNISLATVIICLTFYFLTTSASALNPYNFFWE